LNVLKYLDVPQALAMASGRSKLRLYTADKDQWKFLSETAANLGRKDAVQLLDPPAAP
jgi:hypothetical protein